MSVRFIQPPWQATERRPADGAAAREPRGRHWPERTEGAEEFVARALGPDPDDPPPPDALDRVHVRPDGRRLTMRQLVDAARELGLFEELDDAWFRERAAAIVRTRALIQGSPDRARTSIRIGQRPGATDLGAVLQGRAGARNRASLVEEATPVERVRTTDTMGVAQIAAARGDEPATVTYGDLLYVMLDIAEMGGGVVRRFQQRDLTWYALFPLTGFEVPDSPIGATIPPPDEMADTLVADSFWSFDEIVLYSLFTGVRLSPTLFEDGGGGPLNAASESKTYIVGTSVAYADVAAGKPSWYKNVIVPSSNGWDPFYWDDEAGSFLYTAEVSESGLQPDALRLFGQYGLDTYFPISDPGFRRGDYTYECARRKALGVAAFGEAIAAKLTNLVELIKALGLAPTDVFASLEVSNEADFFYDATEDGAAAYATYLAHLVGPIVSADLGIPIRAAELTSWVVDESEDPDDDPWDTASAWLGSVLSGIVDVTRELSTFRTTQYGLFVKYRSGDPAALTLANENDPDYWRMYSRFQGGYLYPDAGTDLNGRAYVHQVGYHIFHCWDTDPAGHPPTYRTTQELAEDVEVFLANVVTPGMALGFSLGWSCSAVGFAAERPDSPGGNYYAASSPELQAGMLVRYVLLLRASGGSSVSWFTFMGPVKNFSALHTGGEYDAMGLHLDLARAKSSAYAGDGWYAASADSADAGGFLYGENAYRRVAWFAFQRLAALLGYASSMVIVQNEGGITVIRLSVVAQDYSSIFDGVDDPGRYNAAYVLWLDQGAAETEDDYFLSFNTDASMTGSTVGWAELPLVPGVTYTPSGNTSGDAYGSEATSWSPLGWATALETGPGVAGVLRVRVPRAGSRDASPSGEPRPFCVLVLETTPGAGGSTTTGSGTKPDSGVLGAL